MNDMQPKFIDPNDHKPQQPGQWPAVIIPKERIDSEVARLSAAPKPDNGRLGELVAQTTGDMAQIARLKHIGFLQRHHTILERRRRRSRKKSTLTRRPAGLSVPSGASPACWFVAE